MSYSSYVAAQMVKHLLSYLSEADTRNVLLYHQKQLVSFIHVQMQEHRWEKATGYEVAVSKGFTELKSSAYTAAATDTVHDFRQTVQERSRIAQMLFGGFQRCLYPIQKFQSDSERRLAVIVDRDALKWFKPARGQFQIYYKLGVDHLEYQPDFVAETADCIYMLEAKARNDMHDTEVQAKKDAAVQWCHHATHHAVSHGGKPWQYMLIPHDVITENMTLAGLASQFRAD
jgi:type III restriction enzyme